MNSRSALWQPEGNGPNRNLKIGTIQAWPRPPLQCPCNDDSLGAMTMFEWKQFVYLLAGLGMCIGVIN